VKARTALARLARTLAGSGCRSSPQTEPQQREIGRGAWTPLIVGLLLAILAAVSWHRGGTDLTVYWRAARRSLGGEPLYPVSDGLTMYRYSPGAALLLAFLAPLPLQAARALWYLLMIAAVVQIVRSQNGIARNAPGVVVVGLLGIIRPLVDEFHYAQANILVLFMVLAAFAAEDRGRDAQAGVLIALAAGLKLAPLVFVGDYLIRRRWRALLGFLAGVAGLALLPVATYGPAGAAEIHREWFRSLGTSAAGLIPGGGNQSLFGLAARASLPTYSAWIASLLVIGLALAARGPEPRRSLLLLVTALAAPLGWNWNYVLALPAAVFLAGQSRRAAWAVAMIGVSLLIPMYDVAGARVEHWVFEHSLPAILYLGLFVCTALSRGGLSVTPSRQGAACR
jgi:alpha-1,2-mannosyltransferase